MSKEPFGSKPNTSWISFGFGSVLALVLLYGLSNSPAMQPTEKLHQIRYIRSSTSSTTPDLWFQALPQTEPHVQTPNAVKGIYISAWTAGNPAQRKRILDFIKESEEINAIVIDIKDSTGILSYTGSDPVIKNLGTYSKRIKNLSAVVKEFHAADIYVIGRIASFEDVRLGGNSDDFVLKKLNGDPWYGAKNTRQWIDPSNKTYHEYLVRIAREAYSQGVDEINFDYVRYPSEGDLKDIQLPSNASKQKVITSFFSYIDQELRTTSKIIISADVFGLTTTGSGDMGIGQVWEELIRHVDYISPMIYPSHYAPGSFGYKNPADFPAEIITQAVQGAIEKTKKINQPVEKIRPWIQDFNLGAQYDKAKVQSQIEALNSLGNGAYLSWDPRNIYTQGAYSIKRE